MTTETDDRLSEEAAPPGTPPPEEELVPKTSSPPSSPSKRRVAGPRSPRQDQRHEAGSSRTRYYVSPTRSYIAEPSEATTVVDVDPDADNDGVLDPDLDAPAYRSPEPVDDDPMDPHSDIQGLISEHPNDIPSTWMDDADDYEPSKWDDEGFGMDVNDDEKPQIGPGVLPRRWVQMAHPHDLVQPRIRDITKVAPTDDPVHTIEDVWEACPGGLESHHEWFFCTTCGGWLRIVPGQSPLPDVNDTRSVEFSRLQDLQSSRSLAPDTHHHLHEFATLIEPTSESPINRIDAGDDLNAFPHATFGIDDDAPASPMLETPARLYASCSSDLWIIVDRGVIPGQLPIDLVKRFNSEKHDNPNPGTMPNESVRDAWELLSTLLYNPLFMGQRGWVKLDNKRFSKKIGTSILSSQLLQQIGFGCRQEEDALRVGPFSRNGTLTDSQVAQMDGYMLRTWVEIEIYLSAFLARNGMESTSPLHISTARLEDVLGPSIELSFYPRSNTPFGDVKNGACRHLGITKFDTPATAERAYNLLVADDAMNTKAHLAALESLSEYSIPGKERLQTKVATERSLGRYTAADLRDAYARIGFTREYADTITVEPEEAPDHHILELHKTAAQGASASYRRELSQALLLIGRERQSESMQQLGQSGETFLSVDDAYAALSAPKESIDDGLIMQYNLAVADFPGKMEHYRNCLRLIANAPGAERPGIQTFLETGKQDTAPVRKDIPVGLQNIGNTCYLNSILQYMYSIKPLRDEVMGSDLSTGTKPSSYEEGRSRNFVRQLQLLFMQMYESGDSSVRPDEDLAYLAITRPEIDRLVEPQNRPDSPEKRQGILDAIPDIAPSSSSSTRVASPERASSVADSAPDTSILGKRQSVDRDDSSRSSLEHSRQKSEANGTDQFDESSGEDYFAPRQESGLRSPSAVRDIEALNLREDEQIEQYSPPSVPPPLPPRPPVGRKDTLASGLRFGLQQDSAEVLINVLTQLEMGLGRDSSEEKENLIQMLFSCNYQQQLFYQNLDGSVDAQTPVESVFVHPIVGVEEVGKDLHDCLAELYLGGADIEYEGKKGYMMDLMESFPPLLYIQMRRSQFDLTTGRERKSNTHIPFQQVMSLDRYLVMSDRAKREQSIDLTRKMMQVRARLQRLRNHKPLSIPDTFKHVREALGALVEDPDLNVDGDFLDALDAEQKACGSEIEQLERTMAELKDTIETLWHEATEYEYELVAVFMHRGRTSGAGHYWTYQSHLPDHSEEFFKYNDESVSVVPQSEVLQDRTGSDANPALLCYVRRGKNLVETLHRRILEQETIDDAQQQ